VERIVLNQRGGVINIIIALIILVFVLLALMQPISQLSDVADDKIATLQSHTRQAKDINGTIVNVDGGASYGDLTMSLMFGLGTFFFIGLIIYIIRFGPNRPLPPQGGEYIG